MVFDFDSSYNYLDWLYSLHLCLIAIGYEDADQ